MKFTLDPLPSTYAIYFFSSRKFHIDEDNRDKKNILFILKENETTSIIAKEGSILNADELEGGYRVIRINGPIPFNEYGVLNSLLKVLAENKIPVLVHSTFHNDYIFVKDVHFEQSISYLSET